LKDPLLRSIGPGYLVTPRPGHVEQIQVPLVMHGEMAGTTYVDRGSGKQPLPGVKLELVDAANRVVRALRTEFDGYFDLADIKPGSYQLQVPREEAERLGLEPPPPKALRFEPTGTLLDDVGLVLVPQQEPSGSGTPASERIWPAHFAPAPGKTHPGENQKSIYIFYNRTMVPGSPLAPSQDPSFPLPWPTQSWAQGHTASVFNFNFINGYPWLGRVAQTAPLPVPGGRVMARPQTGRRAHRRSESGKNPAVHRHPRPGPVRRGGARSGPGAPGGGDHPRLRRHPHRSRRNPTRG
jgi:hypothetical protein